MIIAGIIFLFTGSFFILLGIIGIFRMPDVYNKIQAGTKATTLGFLSLIAGMLFIAPQWWGKLLLLAGFVLITAPIGSHNLARAYTSHSKTSGEDR
ncbi:MAG: monovalent cation/H(+) antiporter subunit G [Spirochaetales bacterium]|nr:monovalent cation/H(+) antiporter subunit G [Spirochaetales bacterium]